MKKGGAFIKHTAKESEGSIPDNQIGYAVVDTVVSTKDGKAVESVRYRIYSVQYNTCTCSCSMCVTK